MPNVQPTFHESWYRLADVKLRMRASVHIVRQIYRGQRCYVVQDQANNAFVRLHDAAYQLVGLLDGRRSLRQAWEICCKTLGDHAITQGEALHLVSQLAANNLLESELPPDAAGMFERFKKRKKRELQGAMMNILFPRIPIFDPDAILEKGIFLVGWIFSLPGLLLWIAIIGAAIFTLLNRGPGLSGALTGAVDLLRPGNWLLLYAAFVFDKAVHESGHAIACKKFGKQSGTSGEVHVVGLMLLVFTPVPYVDASSSWILRSRWQRMMVGAAGMWMEFALASISAIVWSLSSPASALHDFCFNLMFIASVSTVFFNGNPFLRYDGYYILADLVEIPNLLGKSMQYLMYLIKHYAFGVENVINPTESRGQRIWLLVYLVLAGIVRVVVSTAIVLFLVRELHNYPEAMLLLAIMAAAGLAAWLLAPIGRCLWYLAGSSELMHHRARAWLVTIGAAAAVLGFAGAVPMPNHCRVEAVTRAKAQQRIYVRTSGFVRMFAASGTGVRGGLKGTVLLQLSNPTLVNKIITLQSRLNVSQMKWRKAMAKNTAKAEIYLRQLRAVREQLALDRTREAALIIRSPIDGTWIAPELHLNIGAYLHRGERVGTVANLKTLVVLGAADQNQAGRIIRSGTHLAQIRIYGRPNPVILGIITKDYPAGSKILPSEALSYLGGGPFAPDVTGNQPRATGSPFFLLEVRPLKPTIFMPGQRVEIRVPLPPAPMALQLLAMLRRALEPQAGT